MLTLAHYKGTTRASPLLKSQETLQYVQQFNKANIKENIGIINSLCMKVIGEFP